MTYIKVNQVRKRFGHLSVLKDITFELEKCQVLAVIGPSGSGKTTLLRCLNNLEQIDYGLISLNGEHEITPAAKLDEVLLRQMVGMVFQGFHLWPHLTVLQNLILAPLRVLGRSKIQAVEEARDLLEKVGLLEKESSYPLTLSSGQQQRVAIARALAMNPEILLLDEITSALDPELVWEVLEVIKAVVRERQKTIIMVTHEMGFAREIANQVIFLDKGKIIEQGSPSEVLDSPKEDRTQEFLKRILAGKV